MALNATLSLSVVVVVAALLGLALGQEANLQQGTGSGASGGMLSRIPGGQTAAGVLASSANGVAQYFAPDGPIQPALTAIGGLPMRATEMANRGITRLTSGIDSGARSLARQAGQDENNIRMPGMQTLGAAMPQSVANMGSMAMRGIRAKNTAIAGQAEAGVQAAERLRTMMQQGLVRSAGPSASTDPIDASATMMMGGGHKVMASAGDMMSGAQDALSSGAEQIKNQLKQSLDGTMGRMSQMQGIGENVQNQAHGIVRTIGTGLSNSASQLQQTGQQVAQQLQGGLKQNTQAMSGVLGSMQGSMGKMGENAHNNLQGIVRHAQSAAQLPTDVAAPKVEGQ